MLSFVAYLCVCLRASTVRAVTNDIRICPSNHHYTLCNTRQMISHHKIIRKMEPKSNCEFFVTCVHILQHNEFPYKITIYNALNTHGMCNIHTHTLCINDKINAISFVIGMICGFDCIESWKTHFGIDLKKRSIAR